MSRCIVCGSRSVRFRIGPVDYCGDHAEQGVELYVRQHALIDPPPNADALDDAIARSRAAVRYLLDQPDDMP
jgi:hypothetical protein